MHTGRKVRSDAKLERLSPAQKQRLLVWLDEENLSYLAVAALVRAEFGLVVGKSAVAGYWHRHVLPRRLLAESAAPQAIPALPEAGFTAASLKLARMQAFCSLNQPEPDVGAAVRLLTVVNDAERVALARQRQALAERRATAALLPPAVAPVASPAGETGRGERPAQPPLYPGYAALGCAEPDKKVGQLPAAA